MPILSLSYNSTLPPPNCYTAVSDRQAFAVIRYGAMQSAISFNAEGILTIDLAMPILGHSQGQDEVWHTDRALQREQVGPLHLVYNDTVLFGALRVDSDSNLEQATQQAYESILGQLHHRGYPYPLRIWNYLPAIVEEEQGMERYQLFCSGRHTVLATDPDYENRLPAASALGTNGPGFIIYFIAARKPLEQVENPLQVSAFHYPSCYAPKSPSFSRAAINRWSGKTYFYLSGTASIRGHESRYCDNVQEQTQLTLDNIEHLLAQAHQQSPAISQRLDSLGPLKVYLRNSGDYPVVRDILQQRLGESHPLLYLQADICRKELLVEIEGMSTFDKPA